MASVFVDLCSSDKPADFITAIKAILAANDIETISDLVSMNQPLASMCVCCFACAGAVQCRSRGKASRVSAHSRLA